ncbi:MAG: 50S ribosomal protein L24 [Candidatus Eiseniibacteriota bacterium]|jgi:large subunit ribosomal protein L24
MHIAKNDIVEVISGNQAGTRGKVLKVFPDKRRIIVEKVNLIKRHTRPTQQNPAGGILEKEAPIHVSNVMLVCQKCGNLTRSANKRLADGGRERVCKKCEEMIPRMT